MYNNLGNLELATGKTTQANEYYENALQIWLAGGDDTAFSLAVTYLCMGRLHMLRGKYADAHTYTTYSSELLGRTTGSNKGFLALYVSLSVVRSDRSTPAKFSQYSLCLWQYLL